MEKNSSSERLVPSLLVYDMGETLAFYRKLGFEVTGCDGTETSSTWAEVSRGQITFQFYSEPPHGTPETPICSGTFYVFTNGVDALALEFRDKVEFAWGPETMDYGMKEFAVQDPNGYLIAFSEPA
jgi:catechol 2,3-dioxygenase-like lactoylglutathione lyase family enzyme